MILRRQCGRAMTEAHNIAQPQYLDDDEFVGARQTAQIYGQALASAGYGAITTEIRKEDNFFYAEDYHQQYLHKTQMAIAGSQDVRFRQIFAFRLDLLWCLVYYAGSMTNLAVSGMWRKLRKMKVASSLKKP